mmetsp:Transcript_88151/g.257679  ORF Transcript_88151/g.257679 Transcript_88151/m.257679 type:complete len:219 (-) Transcript_88151:1225-1881(-)
MAEACPCSSHELPLCQVLWLLARRGLLHHIVELHHARLALPALRLQRKAVEDRVCGVLQDAAAVLEDDAGEGGHKDGNGERVDPIARTRAICLEQEHQDDGGQRAADAIQHQQRQANHHPLPGVVGRVIRVRGQTGHGVEDPKVLPHIQVLPHQEACACGKHHRDLAHYLLRDKPCHASSWQLPLQRVKSQGGHPAQALTPEHVPNEGKPRQGADDPF